MHAKPLAQFRGQILIIGCGNMAGAMLRRWIDTGLSPSLVAVIDPARPKLPGGVAVHGSVAAWRRKGVQADVVLLGIKPQGLAETAPELASHLAGATLISMLAGATLADLVDRFAGAGAVVRIMPNMPVALGKGIVAVATAGQMAARARQRFDRLLAPLGRIAHFADDSNFDLMTAFAGSGPAYVYRMVDAYRAAGERLGLDAAMASDLAEGLFAGALAMLAETDGETPASMAARVTSKGGTTQAGLDILDADGRLVALLTETLRAARDRGKELADLARSGSA
jgi:pyrroline-5-carboxylate reductase